MGNVSDSVFEYIKWYLICLGILSLLLPLGLSDIIANDISVTAPVLGALPTPETCEGAFCFLTDIANAVGTFISYLLYFFENIAFMFSLATQITASAWGILGIIFTIMTSIFVLCILILIKPA